MRAGLLLSGFLYCLAWNASPATSQAPEETPQRAPDPVVTGVIEMLEANVAEAIILRWLPTVQGPSSSLSSRELVALTQAGASEALLNALLDKSMNAGEATPAAQEKDRKAPEGASEKASTEAPRAPSADKSPEKPQNREAPRPRPRPTAQPAAEPEGKPIRTPAPKSAPAPLPTPTSEAAGPSVRFQIDYFPAFEEEEDPWDLYLYLDGEALAGVSGSRKQRDSLVVEKQLPPGRHNLLVLQERHQERRRSRGGWFHEARVWPETLSFEVPEGSLAVVSLEFLQAQFSLRPTGPLTWTVSVDGKATAGANKAGPAPEDWKPLCEEVEANLPKQGKGPFELRQQLKRCVRWAPLWPSELSSLPSRSDLRGILEAVEFEPSKVAQRP
ncbi:MAG: hypothetical protein K0U98_15890 [Deltaproteobacteria bacterium]|nr:hypothetical protein [Deltaproteobacteria bacterium]